MNKAIIEYHIKRIEESLRIIKDNMKYYNYYEKLYNITKRRKNDNRH